MHTYGLEVDETLLLPFGGRYEDSYNAAYTITQNPNPCTAVVCCSDIAAIDLMLGLRDCGLKVPEDVLVIGFDDIAKCAVELLIKRIKEKKLPSNYQPEQLKLPPELMVRESCCERYRKGLLFKRLFGYVGDLYLKYTHVWVI